MNAIDLFDEVADGTGESRSTLANRRAWIGRILTSCLNGLVRPLMDVTLQVKQVTAAECNPTAFSSDLLGPPAREAKMLETGQKRMRYKATTSHFNGKVRCCPAVTFTTGQ